MENLKLAKIFLGIGIVLGLSVPISVMYDQVIKTQNRKKSILIDQERINKKVNENPNLQYKKDLTITPFGEK